MKAAVQVLKKAEELKQKVTCDILNDNEAWTSHQKLQDLYQQLLVIDLEYALDKKVEQDLWNYVFKNQINVLQTQAKDRKNPQRTESQENLVWFLEAASGFYLQLLQELCETFDLDIPCRRKGSVYGATREIRLSHSDFAPPHKSSCLYICQHCLVHLGDIARYRNQSLQAETFYRHAAELVPSNGQPYNQLAILEAAKGDKLSTVFYYVRSIAVKYPFPVASTNLQKMFSKIANDEFQHEGKTKLSVYDYVTAFLQFHALIHLASDLEKAQKLGRVLASNLTILIATESLTAWKLIQMTAINLFSIAHATRGLESTILEKRETEPDALSEEEQTSYNLVLELIASTLNGLLLLVYTMKEDYDLKSYYALPVIKLILEWLRQDPSHLKAASFTSKLQIWPSFCKLLNAVQTTQVSGFDVNKYVDMPLPEDWDLQSFLPLYRAYRYYSFKESLPHFSNEEEHTLRAIRLVALGRWLCDQEIYGVKLMTVQSGKDESALLFEAITPQTPSSDVLKQLEEMSLSRATEGTLSAIVPSNGRQNGVLTTNGKPSSAPLENGDVLPGSDALSEMSSLRNVDLSDEDNTIGKRNGIAKGIKIQQLSSENVCSADKNMSTEADGDTRAGITGIVRERKMRQNVALQTIMQRKNLSTKTESAEDLLPYAKPKVEGKQVTFKTPSPSPPASSSGTPPLPQLASSTPSPIFHGDMTSCYSPLPSPSYSSQLKLKSYGNLQNPNALGTEPNSPAVQGISGTTAVAMSSARLMYSGLPSSDANYCVNSSNKFGFFGNDSRPYASVAPPPPTPQVNASTLVQRMGQMGGRLPAQNKEAVNNAVGNNILPQNSRMGLVASNSAQSMNVAPPSSVSANGSILPLPQPQHGMVFGYPMTSNIGSQQQQQPHQHRGSPSQMSHMNAVSGGSLQVPQNRISVNQAAVVAAAAAAAAKKHQQQQQQQHVSPYAINATLFGQTSQPSWFVQPQSQMGIPPPPVKSPSFDQLFSQLNRPQGPLPMHQGGHLQFSNISTNSLLPNQSFNAAPRPQFPHQEGNPYLYPMLGQMPPDQHAFPPFPPPVISTQSQQPHGSSSAAASLQANVQQGHMSGNLAQMHQLASVGNLRLGGMSAVEGSSHESSHHGNSSCAIAYESSHLMDSLSPRDLCSSQPNLGGSSRQHQAIDNQSIGSLMGRNATKNNQCMENANLSTSENIPSTYSLFNSPWSSGLHLSSTATKDNESTSTGLASNNDLGGFLQPGLQSLWSGPGPSPLERLLEQQKQKKDPAPH